MSCISEIFYINWRCGGVPPLSIRAGRSTPFRSALIPNIYYSRSLLIDRCGGVMFPADSLTIAACKVSLRVQSERSKFYSPGQLCTPPVSFADSPLEEGAFCLPLRGRWLPQADGRSVYNKFRSRLVKYPYERRVSGTPAERTIT